MLIRIYTEALGPVEANIIEESIIRSMAFTNWAERRNNGDSPGSAFHDWLLAEAQYQKKKKQLRERVTVRAYFIGQERKQNGLPGSAIQDWLRAELIELDGIRLY